MSFSGGVFACGEDIRALRLKSKLFDLQAGYANPAPRLCRRRDGENPLPLCQYKRTPQWVSFYIGAEGGIRFSRELRARSSAVQTRRLEEFAIPLPLRIPIYEKEAQTEPQGFGLDFFWRRGRDSNPRVVLSTN